MTVSSYVTRARHSLHSINFTDKQEAFCMNTNPQTGGSTSRYSNGSATQLKSPALSKTEATETIELRTVQEDEEQEPMMSGERV